MAVEVDTRLWWESSTPLGTPMLPLVYITTATSSGPGGLGGTGASSPILGTERYRGYTQLHTDLTTDWNEKTLTDSGKPSVSVLKLGSSMKMTVSTRGHLPLVRMALSLGRREWEVMTRETCTASLTPAPHPVLLLAHLCLLDAVADGLVPQVGVERGHHQVLAEHSHRAQKPFLHAMLCVIVKAYRPEN